MSNNYFQFKQFKIIHKKSAMKVGTDGVLLGAWADVSRATNILDIGTGTGLIAIMIAQRSFVQIDGIEIDNDSFTEASVNLINCKWKDKINLYKSSFQDFSKSCLKKYNLIVSNPPFFNNSFKPNSIEKLKAKHTDNLSYKELLDGVIKLLSTEGKFACILPSTEGKLIIEMANNRNLQCSRITHIIPKSSKPENRLLLEFQKTETKIESRTLIIRNEDNSFTKEYRELTKDFYLDF